MEYLKALGRRIYQIMVKYPLAIAGTVFLLIAAIFMLAMGKNFQIGGLLSKLWGNKKEPDSNIRVTIPKDRINKDGVPIQPGESDEKGYIQSPVSTKIKKPGIFDDPNTVTIIHPEKGEVIIPLPTGVKNSDVEEIIEIEPNVYEVKNNDMRTDVSDIEDIL
jgi:hypothetical protein